MALLLVFQSIIVYAIMIWAMTYFGNVAYKRQYPHGFKRTNIKPTRFKLFNYYYIIPIFIFCFFASLRYNVGVDCEPYKRAIYEILRYSSLSTREIEPAFLFITKLSGIFTDTHYLCFFILALLQICPLYYAQINTTYSLKFFGIVLMAFMFNSLMNGVRQNIAACIFVFLIPFVLEKKKWVWYCVGVYLASLMHKSAYLLFPFGVAIYFLQYKIPNKYIQLVIFILCIIFSDKINADFITNLFSHYGADAGYSDKAIAAYSDHSDMKKSLGLVMYIQIIVYMVVIWYSKNMRMLFNSKVFNIQYNIFFIGICLFLLFYNDFTINRLLYYAKIFMPIIVASCMFYLWQIGTKISQIILFVLIGLMIIYILYLFYKSMMQYPIEFMLYKFDFS